MRVVFIGPPGAGKGTQAVRIAAHLGVKHLSTGEVLREARDQHTEIGELAAHHLDEGSLVPDDLVVRVVDDRLTHDDCVRGYVFDGFPRTLGQAVALDELLAERGAPLDAALEFMVPEDELLRRLAGRGREDDTEGVIRERLRHYTALTAPMASYYTKSGVLRRIDAVGSQEAVFARVCEALSGARPMTPGSGSER